MRRLLFFAGIAFLFAVSPYAYAATLSITPDAGTYSVGDTISARVVVSSSASINAVSGSLSVSGAVTVDSVSKTGSVLNFWVSEPSFSASTAQFEGVSLAGFSGSSGRVVTVTLKARKTGTGTITFQSGQVLANDGQGTDVTGTMTGATYTVIEKAAPAPTPKEKAPAEETSVETEQATAPPPSLQPPVIHLGVKDGNSTIIGSSAYPKSIAVLSFVAVSGSKVFISGSTDTTGAFEFAVPSVLRNGPYAVTASMLLPDGTQTESSEPLTVEVGGMFGFLNWELSTYIALGVIIALILLLGYFLKQGYLGKPAGSSAEVRREVHEAEDVLHRSFNVLRQDLSEHGKKASERSPNQEKTDTVSIKKDLDDAEEVIAKELKDIDSGAEGKSK